MALWEPNKYWFAPDGRGGVAYQQHGNVALTLAGPFGPAAFREETAAGFIRYCAEHALIPCFYSCTDELWPMLRAAGSGGWRWPRKPGWPCANSSSRARNGRTSAPP